jgi:hypothetical protein
MYMKREKKELSYFCTILTMGQPCPLPQRIPRVNSKEVQQALKDAGITLDTEEKGNYVKFTMPTGWKMVDDSWREDLPNFYILDDEKKGRFHIHGSWKETYDNSLEMEVCEAPYSVFVPKHKANELIPSETSNIALLMKASGIKETVPAERQADFQTTTTKESV